MQNNFGVGGVLGQKHDTWDMRLPIVAVLSDCPSVVTVLPNEEIEYDSYMCSFTPICEISILVMHIFIIIWCGSCASRRQRAYDVPLAS